MSRSRRASLPRDFIRPRRREREHWLLKHERELDEHRDELFVGVSGRANVSCGSVTEPPPHSLAESASRRPS